MTELPISVAQWEWDRSDDERDLIERAKSDRDAFGELYRRHYRAMAQYIHRRVGDAHATDDLVSELFLSVIRALPNYRYRGLPFRSWLYRIATHTVNRWARKQRRHASASLDDIGVVSGPRPGDGDERDDPQRVRTALLALSLKHQAVLALHYLEGLSVEEVASVLGCRIGTVKSRLSRGRDALRERMTRRRC